MKTIVTRHLILTFLICACSLTNAFAQSPTYAPDEFIMMYESDATEVERQAVRDLYSITEYEPITVDIELWINIPFPLTVPLPDGTNDVLANPMDMLYDIHIQEGGENNNSARASVNDGNLNYETHIDLPLEIVSPNGYSPIPFCTQEEFRIHGTLSFNEEIINIVILDQALKNNGVLFADEIESTISNDNEGGFHGIKVASVISRILDEAGMAGKYSITGITVFDNLGKAKFSNILAAFSLIETLNIENTIVTFSASMIIYDTEYGTKLWQSIDLLAKNNNLLLVSSAGNDGLFSNHVFPGSADLTNEITVVGTENCFQSIWSGSNYNPTHFEIAAEAKDILTTTNDLSWSYSDGTSYSTALVTAVTAQIANNLTEFSPSEIKNQLLNTADQNPSLSSYVREGRVLNATAATIPPSRDIATSLNQNDSPIESIFKKNLNILVTSQNPFTNIIEVEFSFPKTADRATIILTNNLGQIIQQEHRVLNHFLKNEQWTSPINLPPGTYFLSVIVNNNVMQIPLIKQ